MTAALRELDAPTAALIRLAAAIAGGTEASVRDAFAAAAGIVPPRWTEELVLQSYLFSGFPRALNAAREWRRVAPSSSPADGASSDDGDAGTIRSDVETVPSSAESEDGGDYRQIALWRARGEATCAAVYDGMYEKLRDNVRELHPALDAWMVIEGYGKVLGRPGLDLPRRELCIVAACAASGQDRQLHSHLHGALNVGVSADTLRAAIDALEPTLGSDCARGVRLLLARVVGK